MKICTNCSTEKEESKFYKDVRSKTGRLESYCKDCRLIQQKERLKNAVKKKFEPKQSGNKQCVKCGITKNIVEYCVNKTQTDGRNTICKICAKKKAKKFRLAKGPMYALNTVIDDGIEYFKQNCEVCDREFLKIRPSHKRCDDCSYLVRDTQSHLCNKRGRNKNKNYKKCTVPTVIEICKKYIIAVNCCYCGKIFSEAVKKSLDHIIPISAGGSNESNNIAICCLQCNYSKRDLLLNDWIDLCKKVVQKYEAEIKKPTITGNF